MKMPRVSLEDFSAQNFRALRVKSGMSITDLAIATGLCRGSISKWEHGRANPSPENFLKAMEALGANPDFVVPDKGEESTLFDLRARAGLSRRDVYAALGISRSTWGDIERGIARLSKARIPVLAQLFDVPEELVEAAASNTLRL